MISTTSSSEIPSAAGGGGSSVLTQVEVTISEAEMDALHTTGKELVVNNNTGFLINSKDYKSLAKKTLYFLENEHIAFEFGKAGKERINEHFNLNKMVSAYIELYQKYTIFYINKRLGVIS